MKPIYLNIRITEINGLYYGTVYDAYEPGSALAIETGLTPREAIINLFDLIDLTPED